MRDHVRVGVGTDAGVGKCKLCSVPGLAAQYNWVGGHNVWRRGVLGEQKQPTTTTTTAAAAAAAAVSTMEAEYQACGAVAREGLSLRKALDELTLFSSDFSVNGPWKIEGDTQAALLLCKGHRGSGSNTLTSSIILPGNG
jgi:hypothetical protein